MKKAIFLVVISICILFASCTKDTGLQQLSVTPQSSIIAQLRQINDNLKDSFMMRSGNTYPTRNYVSQVDDAAALAAGLKYANETVSYCESHGWTYAQISTYMNSAEYKRNFQAYVSSAANSASQKAGKNSGDCTLLSWTSVTTSSTYVDACDFYFERDDIGNDSIMSKYSVQEEVNLSLPENYTDIHLIGMCHNGIIKRSLLNVPDASRRAIIQPIEGGGLVRLTDIVTLFSDEEFQEQFNDLGDIVDDCLDSCYIDYSSLFDWVAGENYYANEIGELFLEAILYCETYSDVLTLANSYINTIKNSNTLEAYEKRALFSCFTIAVYSFSLWEELMDTE